MQLISSKWSQLDHLIVMLASTYFWLNIKDWVLYCSPKTYPSHKWGNHCVWRKQPAYHAAQGTDRRAVAKHCESSDILGFKTGLKHERNELPSPHLVPSQPSPALWREFAFRTSSRLPQLKGRTWCQEWRRRVRARGRPLWSATAFSKLCLLQPC